MATSFRLIAALTALLATSPALIAEQPGAAYAPLSEVDVQRVVTTLTALIDTAEAGNTAAQSTDIVQRGWAADVLWNVESAVAAIDGASPSHSTTLQRLLVANGYAAAPGEVLPLWRHYSARVLRADDAGRLLTQNRDLGAEWLELESGIRTDGADTHADTIAELDYLDSLALFATRDRGPVLAWADELHALRARVAGWP